MVEAWGAGDGHTGGQLWLDPWGLMEGGGRRAVPLVGCTLAAPSLLPPPPPLSRPCKCISSWAGYIARARQPHNANGYCTGPCSARWGGRKEITWIPRQVVKSESHPGDHITFNCPLPPSLPLSLSFPPSLLLSLSEVINITLY